MDAVRRVVVVVFDGELALGVGPQVRHRRRNLAADAGQFDEGHVGQRERQRHEFGRLVAGIAEHHALVAGALFLFFLAAHALVYVATLAVDGGEHGTGFRLKLVLTFGVTDFLDDIADGLLYVDPTVAGHLAANYSQTGSHQRLAGHMTLRVTAEKFIQKRITNLVGHFVGMPLTDTF